MNVKRCKSMDRMEGELQQPSERQRYKGRRSLQQAQTQAVNQTQSIGGGFGHPKQRRRRYQMKKNTRRHKCDYLEDLDEICKDNFKCLESDLSSSPLFRSRSDSSSDTPILLQENVHQQAKLCEEKDVLKILNSEIEKFKRKMPLKNVEFEDEQRHKFGDVLWLHLKAYFANRPMNTRYIRQSLALQDQSIMKLRQRKMEIVEKILAFKFGQNPTKKDMANEFYQQIYDCDQMTSLNAAINTVSQMLNRWAELAELYPNLMAMRRAIMSEINGNDIFQRVDTLQTWLNVTKMLLEKMNEIGHYFNQIEGRHQTTAANDVPGPSLNHTIWPWPELDPNLPISQQLSELLHKISTRVVGRSLRIGGMIIVLRRLQVLTKAVLEKACLSLLQPRPYAQIAGRTGLGNFMKYLKEKFAANNGSGSALLIHHKHFSTMNLPSFRPHFLFILRLPIHMASTWLEMRSQKVEWDTEWDLLTLDTLVEDSHDCLAESIRVKNDFLIMWNLTNSSTFDNDSANLLAKFDGHLELVFHNYLSYIRLWAQTAGKFNGSEWNEKIVGKMQKEWENARSWGIQVNRGELDSARMFCNIGRDMLDLVIRRYLNEKFDCAELMVLDTSECEDEENDFMLVNDAENIRTASSIIMLCRAFKEMIRQLRERTLRSLAFIRSLCYSIEFCARYEWESMEGNCDDLVEKLLAGGRHVVISFPTISDFNFLILCTREMANKIDIIDRLLQCATSTSNQSEKNRPKECRNKISPPNYLILIPSAWISTHADDFPEKIMMKPTYTLQHFVVPNNIYMIASDRDILESGQRTLDSLFTHPHPGFSALSGRLVLVDDFCSCNDELAEEICDLKRATFECVREVWAYSRDLGEYVLNGKRLEDLQPGEKASLKATLLQAWTAVFECQKELSHHIVSYRMHSEFFSDLLITVNQWAKFITESIGVESSRTVIEQLAILMGISKKIYNSGKVKEENIRKFVEYVQKVTCYIQSFTLDSSPLDKEENSSKKIDVLPSQLAGDQNATDQEFEVNLEILQFGEVRPTRKLTVEERIKINIEWLEERRQKKLQGQRRIGHVLQTDRKSNVIKTHFFTPRKAPFVWQRLENSELGSGSFGSVFLAMNLRDKFLLAVKQIPVRHENEPSLRSLIHEVEILRTLNHTNLIKYYGVEVHKTEVLIFMEYCSEGTLARVCREGLDLAAVRRYTHYLFQAIAYIHDHGIVHRDIKSANIFLAAGEKLKLGDFGCSFRLDGTNTMLSYVGTVRYMAPEIQTNGVPLCSAGEEQRDHMENERMNKGGYGRAVDIWSAGCVVLEMLTGKRPFHYLGHEFQVIYQLGMGIAPRIPADIQNNQMSYAFLRSCFVVDPLMRSTAKELLQQTFANILAEETTNLII